jgi:outer membrane immunogenic protein
MRVSPNTLAYVKGGYTNARYNILADNGTTELDQNYDLDGFRVGAGAEMALTEKAFAKLEYRYSKYSEAEIDYEDNTTPDTDRFNIDTDRHQVVASVGMRF